MATARILLVDDTPEILRFLDKILTSEGYDITTSDCGEKAGNLIKSDEKFDLMITDVTMTPVGGMSLLRLARKVCPSMQVIMLTATAYYMNQLAEDALQLGAFEWIQKPFTTDAFLKKVQQALESS